jgi:hypothetical protein
MSPSLLPDADAPPLKCPACDVVMHAAHRGHASVLYVCPCCGGALTVPPIALPGHVPSVPMEKG